MLHTVADIVGFTAWSSNRSPTDVFFLLESFFGAFDECANRRGIYKLETVGDCYVAGTMFGFTSSSRLTHVPSSCWSPHAKKEPCGCHVQICP